MKFKVLEGTQTFDNFKTFFENSKRVNKQALDLAYKLGFEEFVTAREVSGGISAFVSKEKRDGYKQVYKKHGNNFWFPKSTKENKELINEINNLPVITIDEFNSIIGFEPEFIGDKFIRRYSLSFSEIGNCYMVDTGIAKDYKPNSDMIEILESEYNKLREELQTN
jgi:hypothetical protein